MSEFNRGIYDYVIATDEVPELQPEAGRGKKGHRRKKDREYGVARGIDFQGGWLLCPCTVASIISHW